MSDDTEEHHISEPRINDRIRVAEVRLVGPAGEQVGIVRVEDALRLAQDADLDLVEVAPDARPPVVKIMDYGKYKYEADMKAREARRNQTNTVLKEIRFRLKIDPHDYGTKLGHVERFLKGGDKVKVMIMFRGREQSRPEAGVRLLQRLAGDVAELGFIESMPKQDGRNMIMVLGPVKKKAEQRSEARRAAATQPKADDQSLAVPTDDAALLEDETTDAAPVHGEAAETVAELAEPAEPADQVEVPAQVPAPAVAETAAAPATAEAPARAPAEATAQTAAPAAVEVPAAAAPAGPVTPRPPVPRPAAPATTAARPAPRPPAARPAAPAAARATAPAASSDSSAVPRPPRPAAPRATSARPATPRPPVGRTTRGTTPPEGAA
ncbi:MAG TPA: translation initiation factor IF-3 [Cellulomonas sp.]